METGPDIKVSGQQSQDKDEDADCTIILEQQNNWTSAEKEERDVNEEGKIVDDEFQMHR